MDDFLGTAIQYSEQQIKLLEQEHAEYQEKIVEELINSGFLESDYDESTETEISDNESDEVKEMFTFTTASENDSSPSPHYDSESIENLSPNAIVFHQYEEEEAMDDEKEQYELENIEDHFDILLSKSIINILDYILSECDIKKLVILLAILMTMPFIENTQQQRQHDPLGVYGGIRYQNDYEDGGCGGQQRQYLHETSIYWRLEPMSLRQTDASIMNEDDDDDDDERDEYQGDEHDASHNRKQHIFKFEYLSKITDRMTHKIYNAKVIHHELKISPCDLNLLCREQHQYNNNQISPNMVHFTRYPQVSRLFVQFGTGLKASPEVMRIFKETMSCSFGQSRSHGLTALIMSFVGIVAFAASNNEYITIQ